ncbi:MAG: hypothetical protein P4M08_16040 [Oligoflexia bacterium]|nr:hypothetical protein [Oligoflexia bacterium]
MTEAQSQTPVEIVANISRVVTAVVDRITGDRAEFPLLVAAACVQGLKNFGIESRVMYGQAAWIEIMSDHSVRWAGCWNGNIHFWVATQFGEVVDLNTSVAYRTRAHTQPNLKAIYSPPMLWSIEVPRFYRYEAEGVAELELTEDKDRARFETVLREINEKCSPAQVAACEQAFPNEPVLCHGRKLLDDSHDTFKHFDRALAVHGISPSPF